ncbi:SLC13 family permease [Rosistilla oblonga]|uniref:Citrate transporter n=1 Tax=Rosistilla oblonga TaxID=2527990 RepID=A0A518J2C7_9BACT|nr:SLC13 family permease [Rosistilla oblonga]QDV59487.1 Citrate transporter [Rosistilla oblonga]
MVWESWFTIAIVCVLLYALARRWASTDLLVLASLAALVTVGELSTAFALDSRSLNPEATFYLPTVAQAIDGFGSRSVVTIALLFAAVVGLELTGGTELATSWLLRRPKSAVDAQLRLVAPVAALSAFLNNTPIVAAMLPVVTDLAKKMQVSPSKFFLPLSYAAILGGMCTLMGTSTNIMVYDMIQQSPGGRPLHFFEPAWVGLPATLIGILYMTVGSRWLMRDRKPAVSTSDDPRQYTVEMEVVPGGPLAGQSIEDAGLRHLPGLYLAEIERGGEVFQAVRPTQKLQSGDILIFVGMLESVVDLQKIRGLEIASEQARKVAAPAWNRSLVEAVVSPRCPLVSKSIREGGFRTHYGAAVIAVARGDRRVPGKLGDVVLQPGDVLLLDAPASFTQSRRDTRDFFLVSAVENASVRRPERAWIALGVITLMVLAAASGFLDLTTAALCAVIAMICSRCCTSTEARRGIDWSVLVVIGAALGIGKAMETTGAAAGIADTILLLAGNNPMFVLAAVYLSTMICTELITNNAAAALMFPMAWSAASSMPGVDPLPFAIAVMIAASAGFATPFGYQTNLMVYGPGGYRFTDYLRFGGPLDLIVFAVAMVMIPWVWPLQ